MTSQSTSAAPSGSPGRQRLHIVSGKGGTGKTTVAGALALALARQGKRVLLAEVEGRQGISQTFDVPPLGDLETSILTDSSGGEIVGLSVDAKTALLEYLQKFYKLGRAGSVLEKVGAIDFATTIAPGVRDVLLIGRVYEAVGRAAPGRHASGPAFDAVVLDAPPTGRIVRFLNVNTEVAHVAKVGPIRTQAESIMRLLQGPQTVVHLVTLLEEMPVQETLDAAEELAETSLRLGSIVLNQVRDTLVPADQTTRLVGSVAARGEGGELHDGVRDDLRSVGLKPTEAVVAGLLAQGRDHLERIGLQAEMEAKVAAAGLPVRRLPHLTDGLDSGGLAVLADALTEQGMI
ncbi:MULTISPECIES: ArsA-related P-loop ATPase [unclassified Janibacter]|uniref:ArsA-related P-loop ATPase n=1 Tax=unclassified Janibacter TaxID=2649294 RepID=UPI003D076FEA